jgi:hypothetical protein
MTFVEKLGNLTIACAEPAATAAVCKDHQAARFVGEMQVGGDSLSAIVDFHLIDDDPGPHRSHS